MLNVRKLCNINAEYNKFCYWCTEHEKILQEMNWICKFYVRDLLSVRKWSKKCTECAELCKRCYEREKMWKRCSDCEKIMLEMYWMWEKFVRDMLKFRKFIKELCWKWETFVTDVLNQKKLFKICTACGNIIRDERNERKIEDSCTEGQKISKEI